MTINFDRSKTYFHNFSKTSIDNGLLLVNEYLNNLVNKYASIENGTTYTDNNETKNDENEYKKITYYNIKNIHDDLISNNLNRNINFLVENKSPKNIGDLTDGDIKSFKSNLFYNSKLRSEICDEKLFETNQYDLYQIFQIVDRGNNNIGNRVVANLAFLYETLNSNFIGGENDPVLGDLSNKTIYSLLSSLAESNGFWLQQIPNYMNLNSSIPITEKTSADVNEKISDVVDQMFGVHTTTKKFGETSHGNNNVVFGGILGFPGYIFQLGTSNSNLTDVNKNIKNNFTDSFCLDISIDDNNLISPLVSKNAPSEIIESDLTSCFTIDFGRQNQQMFNSIGLDTAQFGNTEYSILAWTEMLNSSHYDSKPKNIFPIMEKYMYTCEVSGLGNATIQPLNYFYLRNVPLFTGTYWITNVKHTITPNNMVTTFKGVRQPVLSKNDVRKLLIQNFNQINAKIKNELDEINKVKIEDYKVTSGEIRANTDSDLSYGSVEQLISGTVNKYQEYDGMSVVGSYIATVCGGENLSSNKGMVAYLYNLSKSSTQTPTHSNIIRNMVNAAIADMLVKIEYGDTRFCDNNKSLSLYTLFNTAKPYYTLNGKLSELLSDIATSPERYNEQIRIQNDVQSYSIKAVKYQNQNENITTTNDEIKLIMGDVAPRNSTNQTFIQSANIHLDLNIIYKAQQEYTQYNEFNFKQKLYNIFNSLGDITTKEIKGVLVPKKINVDKRIEIQQKNSLISINLDTLDRNLAGDQNADDVIKVGVVINLKQPNNDEIIIAPLSKDGNTLFNTVDYKYSGTYWTTKSDFEPHLSDIYLSASGDDTYFKLKTTKDANDSQSVSIFNLNDNNYGYRINNTGRILKTSENVDLLKKLLFNDDENIITVTLFVFYNDKIQISEKIKLNADEKYRFGSLIKRGFDYSSINLVTEATDVEFLVNDVQKNSVEYKYLGGYDTNVVFFSSDEPQSILNTSYNIIKEKPKESIMSKTTNDNFSKLEPKELPSTAKIDNMILVKNILKKYFEENLTDQSKIKEITAGIMGNIEKESRFDPEALNRKDVNDKSSYGLIQWNQKFYGDTNKIGKTVKSQMAFLFNNTDYWKPKFRLNFMDEIKNIKFSGEDGANEAAYLFAKIVERCANCTEEYYTDTKFQPYQRSQYAITFYKKFNDTSDPLTW